MAENTTIEETGGATAVADAPSSAPAELAAREHLYEGMFLLDSGKFASDAEGMAKKVTDLIEEVGGILVLHRPWSDGKLAYPIGNHRKGLHYVTYFRMPPRGMTALTRACKLSDFVIRHMVIRQPESLFQAMVDALDPEKAAAREAEAEGADSEEDEE